MATTSFLRMLMAPSSANHMGNVHGGNILRLCEEAGRVVASKHSRGPVAMVGASRTQFRAPIHVGEVATVSASLDYVSRHAMRVSLEVEAENIFDSGRPRRTTNSSTMWYSTVDIVEPTETATVGGTATSVLTPGTRPLLPLVPASLVAPDAAAELAANRALASELPLSSRSPSEFPVVLQVVPDVDSLSNPPDFVSAGYVLKLMDTAGAVAAMAHAGRVCVTVLLDKVCFRTPIRLGDLCTVRAGVTFASARSAEVVVQVWKSAGGGVLDAGRVGGGDHDGRGRRSVCAVESRFVFVALGDDGAVAKMPEMPPEKRTWRWDAGATKHEERVAERANAKKKQLE